MSGHSKWKNIMHKKEKTDAQRAKVFTKIGKEMAIAIRDGGPDPVSNGKLATRTGNVILLKDLFNTATEK